QDKKFPKVVVGAFIRNSQNQVLLVRSYKWPGKWVVMGGHIDWGETIEQAIVREVDEEVGLTISFKRVIRTAEFVFSKDFHDPNKHFIGLQCECVVVGDDNPTIDNDEIQECRWFDLKDALALDNILPHTRLAI